MRKKVSNKIKQENKVLCAIKKEIKDTVINGNEWAIISKYNSENISSEYNVSGVGGYGLDLI